LAEAGGGLSGRLSFVELLRQEVVSSFSIFGGV